VLPAALRAQAITFPAVPDTRVDRPGPVLAATASSGLPVSYTTATPTVCTVRAAAVTLLSVGTCRVTASQGGDATWLPAADVTRSLNVLAGQGPTPPSPRTTVGTAPSSLVLTDVPADAKVSVPVDAATSVRGVARVTVSRVKGGVRLTVVADKGFSGIITLPVTVARGGRSAVIAGRVVVSPEAPVTPVRRPATSRSTAVAWAASPNATGYVARLAGKPVCTTHRTSCTVPALLGPKARLAVTALGNDGTRSTVAVAGYRAPSKPIQLASVYFATDSSRLSGAARARLRRIAGDMRGQGFTSLVLSGHTDRRGSLQYNTALSRARADVVRDYLRNRFGVHFSVSYHAYLEPAASNATAAGRAHNRRTDVSLG
jgi:outer membrane protein OmpA-like peptidoglycan-associated protein